MHSLIHNVLRKAKFYVAFGTLAAITVFCSNSPLLRKSNAERMQEFVIDLSAYARLTNPNFIVVPQNGVNLAYEKANPSGKLYKRYMDAIDGFGVEEIFYFEKYAPDSARIATLRELSKWKKVMASDFIGKDDTIKEAQLRNTQEGFIPYVRHAGNYHYKEISKDILNENADDITNMSQIKNYLYLINPSEFETKEAFLKAVEATNYDLIVIDLYYDNTAFPLTAYDVARLKKKANGGKRLALSYINVGAAENWRYYWQPEWKLGSPAFLKKKYQGYDNEFYVQYWDGEWRDIIFGNDDSYMRKILDAGFDGAYLDNMEAYIYLSK